MSNQQPGARFRTLHEEKEPFIIPNPWDVGTARILARMGYKALATTSAGHAFSIGVPEGTLTQDQVLEHCRQIANATDLPVSADLEKGFGDSPAATAETIRLAAATGIAGGSIEDYTGNPDDPIYAFNLAVERVQAAAEASRSLPDDFVFTARAENYLWGRPDLDDTIRRLQAFEAAGADVLYAPGLKDLDSIRTVCESLLKPVNIVMGLPGAVFGVAELASAGVRRISVGSALSRAAFGTFVRSAREMMEQGTFHFADGAMGFAELDDFFKESAGDGPAT